MIYLITNQKELIDRPLNSGIQIASIKDSLDYLEKLPVIAADTETMGLDPLKHPIISLQLGNEIHQFVIDTNTVNIQHYKNLLTDTSKLFIWQNAQFDLRVLFTHKIYTPRVYDTMLVEKCLTRGIVTSRAGLFSLVQKYCNQYIDKSIVHEIQRDGLTDRVIRYGAKDIEYLIEIRNKQLLEVKKLDLENYITLENKFVIPLAYTMHCGFYLDAEKWTKKADEDIIELNNLIAQLDNFVLDNYSDTKFVDSQLSLFQTGLTCNILWSSSTQVIKFFEFLGLNCTIEEKGKKKKTVDKKHIIKLINDHSIVSIYIKFSEQAKLVSTYGHNFLKSINPTTKRVHTIFNQIMSTGRLSSGQTDLKKNIFFPNLQNLPSDSRHRHCFVPQKGNKLIVGDYSGQEQIILANKSLEPNLLAFYEAGLGDMHSYVASKIFPELANLSLSDIKKLHKDKRQLAKGAGFAINYGGNGYTIANNLNIDRKLADKVYEEYFKAFPKLKAYFTKVQKETFNNGFITVNEISRSKTFLMEIDEYKELKAKVYSNGFWDKYRIEKAEQSADFKDIWYPIVRSYFSIKGAIERDSLNYPIQGTAAEMTKLAGINFFNWIVANDLLYIVKICNLVHDEIVVECPEHLAKLVCEQLKFFMEEAGNVFCKTIKINADPGIVDVWDH
jgi:DNA polymerase-1